MDPPVPGQEIKILVPGQGTKISDAAQHDQKLKKKKKLHDHSSI